MCGTMTLSCLMFITSSSLVSLSSLATSPLPEVDTCAVPSGGVPGKWGRNYYATPPSARIHPIRVRTKLNTQLKLQCKVKGNPWPKVQWYKNKKLIKENKRIQIQTKRKSSVITVKRVKRRDGGRYECRASNILAPISTSKVKVVVTGSRKPTKSSEHSTESTSWHFKRSPCNVQSFCLNGGTCTMIESLQERVCECADGYKGRRCEQKDTIYTFGVLPQTLADIVTTTRTLESVLGK
ncbi:protein vein-like isoform X5 [Tachypleus tridentatus]|uniref:protein vein-like isoform X5 n=1 Tax=Tachypleus tridentatus TaxID=6853 RepID=UPI003FCF51D1